MTKWPDSLHKTIILIGLCVGLALLPTISGCEHETSSSIQRVIQAFVDLKPLPDASERELQRFAAVFSQNTSSGAEISEGLEYFRFAFKRIRTSYVNPVDEAKLIDAAIRSLKQGDAEVKGLQTSIVEVALDAMTKSLDPHSAFLNAQEFRETFIHTKGEFGGLGIEVTMQDEFVKIISPIEDTPAARAGLKPGDLIVAVDGQSIKGLSLSDAVFRMRGPPGEPIELLVRRNGVADFILKIVRAVITVRAVRWRLINRVAYIRVSRFSEKVQKGITQAFSSIRKELGGDPSGIIIDLRNNPGGLLEQSVVLADAFLNKGEIVSVRGRGANHQSTFEASDGDIASGLPIVVLANSGSASASEIVISALKNHKRAVIMGSRTFGKGSVQTIIPMPREGALRLTTALYYGADGRTLQARGVLPDILVEPKKTENMKGRRESDLPGSIPMEKSVQESQSIPRVFLEHCPTGHQASPSRTEGIEDKLLGCALGFLKVGSKDKFLASFGP